MWSHEIQSTSSTHHKWIKIIGLTFFSPFHKRRFFFFRHCNCSEKLLLVAELVDQAASGLMTEWNKLWKMCPAESEQPTFQNTPLLQAFPQTTSHHIFAIWTSDVGKPPEPVSCSDSFGSTSFPPSTGLTASFPQTKTVLNSVSSFITQSTLIVAPLLNEHGFICFGFHVCCHSF